MQVTNVNAAAGISTGSHPTSALVAKSLGQDDFLKLLMAQLGNQDPLQPVSNTEFVSQMAQFTSLSQTSDMVGTLSRMESIGQMQSAAALLGREVTLADGTVGVVREIQSQGGTQWLNLGDRLVTLDEIVSFRTPVPAKRMPQVSGGPSVSKPSAISHRIASALGQLPGAQTLMGYMKTSFPSRSSL